MPVYAVVVWKRVTRRIANEPNLRPVIIPSNTRRQAKGCMGKGREGKSRKIESGGQRTARNWTRKSRLRARTLSPSLSLVWKSSLNFCGCFLQLHLPLSNPLIANIMHRSRIVSYFMRGTWGPRVWMLYVHGVVGSSQQPAAEAKKEKRKEKERERRNTPRWRTRRRYSLTKVVSFRSQWTDQPIMQNQPRPLA